MLRDDTISGAFFVVFGLAAAVLSSRLEIGSPASPGPGFVPLWVSLLLAGFSAALLVSALVRRTPFAPEEAEWKQIFHPRVAVCVASLVAYIAILPFVGFLAGSIALLYVLFGLLEPSRWYWRLISASLTAAMFWFIFQKLLGLQLPIGRMTELLGG